MRLNSMSFALDRVDATSKREDLSVQSLFDLGQSLNPLREELQAKIAELEPRLAQVDARLKQLGPAPAQAAPPESEAIAAERARLAGELGTLDASLKQARLLAARADELAAQITERRRSLYARQLFAPSPSVLSPLRLAGRRQSLRRGAGPARRADCNQRWVALRNEGGLTRGVLAVLTLAGLGIAMAMLWRWWRRRTVVPATAPTRFTKALASIGAFLRIALTAPLVTLAAIEVLVAFQLLPDRWVEIAYGLGIAVAIAAFGRAIASGVLAPDAPWRRLVALDDETAAALTRHLVWVARVLGVLVFVLVLHKVLDAPPVVVGRQQHVVCARDRRRVVALAALLAPPSHAGCRRGGAARALAAGDRLAGAGGHRRRTGGRLCRICRLRGRAAAVEHRRAGRPLSPDRPHACLAGRAARCRHAEGRAIAVNFGVNPRRLGLLASLLSGGICLFVDRGGAGPDHRAVGVRAGRFRRHAAQG